MGYANPKQVGGGIHFRQRARAFIFGDATTGTRAVFVSVDACMGSQALKTAVVEKLAVRERRGGGGMLLECTTRHTHTSHTAPAHTHRPSMAICTQHRTWVSVASTPTRRQVASCSMSSLTLHPWALSSRYWRWLSMRTASRGELTPLPLPPCLPLTVA